MASNTTKRVKKWGGGGIFLSRKYATNGDNQKSPPLFLFQFLLKCKYAKKKRKKGRPGWVPLISCVPRNPYLPEAHCRMLYGALHSLKLRATTSLLLYIYTQSQKCTLITGVEGEEEAQTVKKKNLTKQLILWPEKQMEALPWAKWKQFLKGCSTVASSVEWHLKMALWSVSHPCGWFNNCNAGFCP